MANMCVNDTGYKEAETIRYEAVKTAALYKYAIAAAQIVLNADAAVSNFKKLNDIASDALAIEEEQQAHLSGTYWPYEDQMLAEFTQPTAWDSQQALAKRYAGRIWPPIAAGFAKQMKALECQKPRYCGSAFARKIQELNTQRAATRANVTLWADRIAFYEIQAMRETDWKRRQQVIAMRQGLMGQAASLIAQAQQGFAGAQGKAMAAINNAIELIGYTSTRQQGMGTDPGFNMRTMQEAVNIRAQNDLLNQSYGYTEDIGLNYSQDPSYQAFDVASMIGVEQNYSSAPEFANSGLNINSLIAPGDASITNPGTQ